MTIINIKKAKNRLTASKFKMAYDYQKAKNRLTASKFKMAYKYQKKQKTD